MFLSLFTGGSYTDINAYLPAKIILMVIGVFVAVAIFAAVAINNRLGRDGRLWQAGGFFKP